MMNPNVESLSVPAIPLAGSWADSYNGQYGPLIDLSQAVPNYPPHDLLLTDLSKAAADPGNCGYGDIEGEPLLRTAYSNLVSNQYKATIEVTNTHITSGCNQAFFASLLAVARPGSTVLMVNPCYFNQQATAEVLGLGVKYVEANVDKEFVPNIAAFEQAIDSSVSVIALVSPNNPTGAVYPPELLTKLFDVCKRQNIWLILDETYRDFVQQPDTPLHDLFSLSEWDKHFIQLYSFSKTFCIPGHRVGAVVGSEEVIGGIAKVLDNLQICAPRPAQLALAGQLGQLDQWIAQNNAMIAERAKTFQHVIEQSSGWEIKSLGGYFAYVEHPFRELESAPLVKKMASEYGVLPLPGSFFGVGQESYLRMAFANADKDTILLMKDRLALL